MAAEEGAASRSKRRPKRQQQEPPAPEEIVAALHQKVQESVAIYNNYKHVLAYTLFVALYMLVLYYQASAYQAGEVVAALKQAILGPDGSTQMTFSNEKEVLAFLGNNIVQPVWKDPVCGDNKCEWPWEFPAYGPFGCRADCGLNPNTSAVLVVVNADFSAHPSLSPKMLMQHARWNLCLNDTARSARGQPDLCWFQDDQSFSQVQETQINSVQLVDGDWYIRLRGDYAGRVVGTVYNNSNASDPTPMTLTPPLTSCKAQRRRAGAVSTVASTSVRKLLIDYLAAKEQGPEQARAVLTEGMKGVVEALQDMTATVQQLGERQQARLKALSGPSSRLVPDEQAQGGR